MKRDWALFIVFVHCGGLKMFPLCVHYGTEPSHFPYLCLPFKDFYKLYMTFVRLSKSSISSTSKYVSSNF